MIIHLVILKAPQKNVWEKIREVWPKHHYILNDVTAFVATDSNFIESGICQILGISKEGKGVGLVTALAASANGYIDGALVDWIKKVQADG